MPSPENERAEILRDLHTITEHFTRVSGNDPGNKDLQAQLLRAQVAETAAGQLQTGVLTEIWGFHSAMASHNGAAIRGMKSEYGTDFRARELLSALSMDFLAKNLADHVGRDKVDPMLMPWQYRK